MVRTFSEPAIRCVDNEVESLAGASDSIATRLTGGLPQVIERLRQVVDELAAVLDKID